MRNSRIAVIDRDTCKPEVCGYYLCHKVCPVDRAGIECITVSEIDKKPIINEETCISCMICVKKCPVNAISIVNLPHELNENPIHRYGQNMFALFKLPIPKRNAVIGLIGPNGVGKSTVLNILSGNIKPNAGTFSASVSWDEIIGRFKGSELQDYLTQLSQGKIKTAYKPQHVYLIPKMFSGKVRELLEKADEKNELRSIIDRLHVHELLNKNIQELSGGELQLVAIAATMLKQADFYFFDEPSSYLDVYERLLVATEIRKLTEKAVVMVVEHDLAVADYLADFTHILYGAPAVFGVVSRPYGVRVGINTYLEGFIQEENMRFRPEPIIIQTRSKQSEKNKVFLHFPALQKRYAGFSLKTEPGSLYKGEIVGILGPNGIGKTTFIKLLVGEEKPETGEPPHNLRLSYKPQKIVLQEADEQATVKEFLDQHTKLAGDEERKKFIRLLGLEKLMEKACAKLSGGELQSLFIANTLLQPADVYLLDEPSAFLDIEQRLQVAKLVRSLTEEKQTPAFVVDHDLQFIDAIADRVMVFEGKPGREGVGLSPTNLNVGMNKFLKSLGVTFRRDPQTGRPRANKPGSQKDQEQREVGQYYYME